MCFRFEPIQNARWRTEQERNKKSVATSKKWNLNTLKEKISSANVKLPDIRCVCWVRASTIQQCVHFIQAVHGARLQSCTLFFFYFSFFFFKWKYFSIGGGTYDIAESMSGFSFHTNRRHHVVSLLTTAKLFGENFKHIFDSVLSSGYVASRRGGLSLQLYNVQCAHCTTAHYYMCLNLIWLTCNTLKISLLDLYMASLTETLFDRKTMHVLWMSFQINCKGRKWKFSPISLHVPILFFFYFAKALMEVIFGLQITECLSLITLFPLWTSKNFKITEQTDEVTRWLWLSLLVFLYINITYRRIIMLAITRMQNSKCGH